MRKLAFIFLASSLAVTGFSAPERNLSFIKKDLIRYHDSGEYSYEISSVTDQAQDYLEKRIAENNQLKQKKNLAIVFDIDETALSNYPELLKFDFGVIPQLLAADMKKADDKPIPGTLKLYRYAISHNVTVFFITGRGEGLRNLTIENLKKAGFVKWEKLYTKPENSKTIPYKSSSRRAITQAGYDIVINLGDQYSDLTGGYADRTYKLPNPYYYIP